MILIVGILVLVGARDKRGRRYEWQLYMSEMFTKPVKYSLIRVVVLKQMGWRRNRN